MGVDLFHITSHVKLQELHFDVVAGILVSVRSCGRRQHSLYKGRPFPRGKERAAGIVGLGHRLAAGPRDLTIVVGEADAEVCLFYLLGENVLLVEKEHNGRCGEVAMIADAVEQV